MIDDVEVTESSAAPVNVTVAQAAPINVSVTAAPSILASATQPAPLVLIAAAPVEIDVQLSVGQGLPGPPGEQGNPGAQGVPGEQGPPGTSTITTVFEQATASALWTITHNLGKFPSVTVVDSAGSEVEGSVEYIDANNISITFNAAFAGAAYLN